MERLLFRPDVPNEILVFVYARSDIVLASMNSRYTGKS